MADESERWLHKRSFGRQGSVKDRWLPGGGEAEQPSEPPVRSARSEQQRRVSLNTGPKVGVSVRSHSSQVSRDIAVTLHESGRKETSGRKEMDGGEGGGEKGGRGPMRVEEEGKWDVVGGGSIGRGIGSKQEAVVKSSSDQSLAKHGRVVVKSQRLQVTDSLSEDSKKSPGATGSDEYRRLRVSGHSLPQDSEGSLVPTASIGEHHSWRASSGGSKVTGAKPLTNAGLDSHDSAIVSTQPSLTSDSLAVISMAEVRASSGLPAEGGRDVNVEESWVEIEGSLSEPQSTMTSGSILGPNERTPSNRFHGQVEETEDDEPAKMLAGNSYKFENYQRVTSTSSSTSEGDGSRASQEDEPAKMIAGGSFRLDAFRRAVSSGSSEGGASRCGEIKQLQARVELQEKEIGDLKAKLSSKDERISTLNTVIATHQETAKRGLRSRDMDAYDTQMMQVSEQLSRYDHSDHQQKAEIAKLKRKLEDAEQMQFECTNAATQLSKVEEENKALRLRLDSLEGGGNDEEIKKGLIASLYAEVDRLRPFEGEVQRLHQEVEEGKRHHLLANEMQGKVASLEQQLTEKELEVAAPQEEIIRLQREITRLQEEVKRKGRPTPVLRDQDTFHLKRELSSKEERIATLEAEISSLLSDSSYKQQAVEEELEQLRERVQAQDIQLAQMQSQKAVLVATASLVSAGHEDPAGATVLSPGVVATQEMERLLKEKDLEMVKMAQQLKQFKKVARDLTKIVDHSKGQSRLVVDLKQQLQKAEGQKDDLTTARDSVQAQMDSLQRSKAGLEVALISAQSDSDRYREQSNQLEAQLRHAQAKYAKLKEDIKVLQERERGFLENERAFQERERGHQEKARRFAEKDRKNQAGLARLEVLMREREEWQRKELELKAKHDNMTQDLSRRHREIDHLNDLVAQQGDEVQRLTRENQDISGQIEVLRLTAQTFQEDFEQERRDREKAHGQIATAERSYTERIEQMEVQLTRARQEVDSFKRQLSVLESASQAEMARLRATIDRKEGDLARANIHSQKLGDDLLSKTQQVTHYSKKHSDLKEQLEAYKRAIKIHTDQVTEFAREIDALKMENKRLRNYGEERTLVSQLQAEIGLRETLERKNAELMGLCEQLKHECRTLQTESEYLRRGLEPLPRQPGMQQMHFRSSGATSSPTPHGTQSALNVPTLEGSHRFGKTYPPSAGDPQVRHLLRQPPVKAYSLDDERTLNSRGDPHPPPSSSQLAQSRHPPGNGVGRASAHPPAMYVTQPGVLPSKVIPSTQTNIPSARRMPNTGTALPQTTVGYSPSNASIASAGSHVPHGGYPKQQGVLEGYRYLTAPGPGSGPSSLPQSGVGLATSHAQSDGGADQLTQSLGPGYSARTPGRQTQDDSALRGNQHALERDSSPSYQPPGHDQHQARNEQYYGQPPSRRSVSQQLFPSLQQQRGQLQQRGQIQYAQQRNEQHSMTTNAAVAMPAPSRSGGAYYQGDQRVYAGTSVAQGGTGHAYQQHRQANMHPQVYGQTSRPGQPQQPYTQPNVRGGNLPQSTPVSVGTYPTQETRPPQPALTTPPSHPQGHKQPSSKGPSGRGSQVPTSSGPIRLEKGIDDEIEETAEHLQEKRELSSLSSDDVPFDPNLICPTCRQRFRLGQIQKFRKHVSLCH